jgi:hypothetical protein
MCQMRLLRQTSFLCKMSLLFPFSVLYIMSYRLLFTRFVSPLSYHLSRNPLWVGLYATINFSKIKISGDVDGLTRTSTEGARVQRGTDDVGLLLIGDLRDDVVRSRNSNVTVFCLEEIKRMKVPVASRFVCFRRLRDLGVDVQVDCE